MNIEIYSQHRIEKYEIQFLQNESELIDRWILTRDEITAKIIIVKTISEKIQEKKLRKRVLIQTRIQNLFKQSEKIPKISKLTDFTISTIFFQLLIINISLRNCFYFRD